MIQAPRLLAFGALFLLLGAASLSCGKKGPPIVPGSVVPEAVTDLEAAPHGKNVSLAWTKPRKNTDGTLAADISGFVVLRGEVPPSAKGDKCECEHQAVGRVDLDDPKPGEVEGNRIRFEDRGGGLYPGGLPHGRTYSYQVAAVTKRDYKGKASKAAVVTLSLPPGPPSGLSAAPGEDTAALEWTPPPAEAGRAPISGYLVFRTSEKEAREIQVSPEPVRE
ncbi:MAG: fibronectin type III domain-containing protein, partial [Nitrospirae bacterium]|nr:fibronectin type III domain-containing protein [Nitrospirota bacterium]